MAEEPTPQDQELQDAQTRISHRISGLFLGLIGIMSLVAAVAYVAMPGNDQARSVAATSTPQTVTVAMHDPGCHAFQVGQSFQKSLSVSGPVNVVNSDEAALIIAGSNGTQRDAMGQQVSLAPGTYRITMVDQASDDNTLHLAVN